MQWQVNEKFLLLLVFTSGLELLHSMGARSLIQALYSLHYSLYRWLLTYSVVGVERQIQTYMIKTCMLTCIHAFFGK